MRRFLATFTFAALLCVAPASAQQEPYLGIKFLETKDGKVKATSVDPKAIAYQVGIRHDDVIRSVNRGNEKTAVKTEAHARGALAALRRQGGDFEVTVERQYKNASRPVLRVITGTVVIDKATFTVRDVNDVERTLAP